MLSGSMASLSLKKDHCRSVSWARTSSRQSAWLRARTAFNDFELGVIASISDRRTNDIRRQHVRVPQLTQQPSKITGLPVQLAQGLIVDDGPSAAPSIPADLHSVDCATQTSSGPSPKHAAMPSAGSRRPQYLRNKNRLAWALPQPRNVQPTQRYVVRNPITERFLAPLC